MDQVLLYTKIQRLMEELGRRKDRNPWLSPQFFICRWRLALKTIPVIAAMVGFRFAVWFGAGVAGWIEPSVFTSFIVLAVFVSAVMLQGVIQDFKESEKMPSALQSAFWSLTSELEKSRDCIDEGSKRVFMQKGLQCIADMLMSVIKTLDCKDENPDATFEKATSQTMREAEVALFCAFAEFKVKPKQIAKPIDIIRKALGRIHVIQSTSYIPACYSLMDSMVLIVFTLMTTTNWPRETALNSAIAFTVIISFLFSFLWLMVRSLEDPFEYPAGYNLKCFQQSEKIQMRLMEEFNSIGSIDMSGLTVGFGKHIRSLCKDVAAEIIDESPSQIEDHAEDTANEGKHENSSFRVLRRWYILGMTLPVIAAMIGFRLAVWYGGNVGGWIDPQIFTSFISLSIFVTALLLQGLIQDYKESEKMPSDLLNAFQGLTAAIETADAKESQKSEKRKSLKCIERMLLAIARILDSEGELVADEVFCKATNEIREAESDLFVHLIETNAFDLIKSVVKPLAIIRNLAGRINVIKKTSYILAGYSLADKMILIVFILMTISNWPKDKMWHVAVSFTVVITFLFSYLAILIRKVEDPFSYPKTSGGFNRECYITGSYSQKARTDGLGCVDMSVVMIVFGRQLKGLLYDSPSVQLEALRAEPHDERISTEVISEDKNLFKYLLKRWRIAITALPLVCLLVAARMVVWYGIGVGGWMDPVVFTSFIGIVIFVAVIIIQGIVQDYKEAEKMPSELFSAFEGLATALQACVLQVHLFARA
jgi:hypothetical protein